MTLSDKTILKLTSEYKKNGLGRPLIENFEEKNLQSSSYDFSMTNIIHLLKRGTHCIDLKDQNKIDESYEEIEISNSYIINPGEYILVTVKEKLNLPDNIICEVLPRTRFTRAGLLISNQYCNPSYSGILQIGFHNVTQNSIKIYPGMKIGQWLFRELNETPTEKRLYRNKVNATYQNEEEFRGGKFSKEIEELGKKKLDEILKSLKGED